LRNDGYGSAANFLELLDRKFEYRIADEMDFATDDLPSRAKIAHEGAGDGRFPTAALANDPYGFALVDGKFNAVDGDIDAVFRIPVAYSKIFDV
jgi:hypothetical protein